MAHSDTDWVCLQISCTIYHIKDENRGEKDLKRENGLRANAVWQVLTQLIGKIKGIHFIVGITNNISEIIQCPLYSTIRSLGFRMIKNPQDTISFPSYQVYLAGKKDMG